MAQQSREYQVSFVTPAFLGDAEQKGRWRTPPFKALLRQWWRVVKAREFGYQHDQLREAEGRLFGHAWLKRNGNGRTWAMRSRVQLRLDRWDEGGLTAIEVPRVAGSEPAQKRPRETPKFFLTYLGYGLVRPDPAGDRVMLETKTKSGIIHRPAILPGDAARLHLRFPEEHARDIDDTVALINWFGTLGGRSRNGWGSVALRDLAQGGTQVPGDDLQVLVNAVGRRHDDCLDEQEGRDWPHALGLDAQGRPLVWASKDLSRRWEEQLVRLGRVKTAFRRAVRLEPGNAWQDRHLLAYPVTNSSVLGWDQDARLANQLRFKIVKRDGGYAGLIFHLPCRLPEVLARRLDPRAPSSAQQIQVWQRVHDVLDQQPGFRRLDGRAA